MDFENSDKNLNEELQKMRTLMQNLLEISNETLEQIKNFIESSNFSQEQIFMNIAIVSEIRYKSINLLMDLLLMLKFNNQNEINYSFLVNQLQQRKVYYFLLKLLQNKLITIEMIWKRAAYDPNLAIYFKDEISEYDRYFFRNHMKMFSKDVKNNKNPNKKNISVKILDYVSQEEREKRENNDKISVAIRKDDASGLEKLIKASKLKFTHFIKLSINEMYLWNVATKNPTLVEYAAFYGSFKCFKLLVKNLEHLPKEILSYAVAGGKIDMYRLCEKSKVNYDYVMKDAIKYHCNSVTNSLIKEHNIRITIKYLGDCIAYNNYNAFQIFCNSQKNIDMKSNVHLFVLMLFYFIWCIFTLFLIALQNAAKFSALNYLKLLLPKDFDINMKDKVHFLNF